MLKFGRFKASLNFYNGKGSRSSLGHDELGSVQSVTGAYRINRDEFLGYNYPETPRKITPSVMPVPPTEPPVRPMRQAKSTSDLIKTKNLPPNLQQENPGISQDPRGAQQPEIRNSKPPENNNNKERKLDAQKIVDKQRLEEQKKIDKQRIEEQKKLEKRRLEEQKKQQKLALQEQARQEKLRKEREKKEAAQAKKDKKKKRAAPQRPLANPLAAQANTSTANPVAQSPAQYSTNTLDSSISKTSGPPPYNDLQKPVEESKPSDNVTYSKPVDTGSWDMISQHRQQINRPLNTAPMKLAKQTVMDLNYKVDVGDDRKDNSEV